MAKKSKLDVDKLFKPSMLVFIVASLLGLAATLVLIQARTFVQSEAKGKKGLSNSCITLSNELKRSENTQCGDPKFSPVADLNKDQTVNLADQNVFNKNAQSEEWCESSLNLNYNSCELEAMGPNCGELLHQVFVSMNSQCGDSLYSSNADLDSDSYVAISDYSIFLENKDNEAWCEASLNISNDVCANPVSLNQSCGTLFHEIQVSLNTQCGDDLYNPVADVNDDGYVAISDFNIFQSNLEDTQWCKSQLASTNSVCN